MALPGPSSSERETPWLGCCLPKSREERRASQFRRQVLGSPRRPARGRDEDWRATLDREVLEEACARVETASLLGFSRGLCTRGREEGLVLVRALWLAWVALDPWEPRHEIKHRLLVPSDEALARIDLPEGQLPIYHRWFDEAATLPRL